MECTLLPIERVPALIWVILSSVPFAREMVSIGAPTLPMIVALHIKHAAGKVDMSRCRRRAAHQDVSLK